MREMIARYLAIGLAGSAGALLRYVIGAQVGRFNIRFPLGTFIINITGSFFLGWFLTYVTKHNISDTTRLAIGVGFVGAYTTFSTFMYDSVNLIDQGAILLALANLGGSLFIGLASVWLGMLLAKST
jgi:CrcB protein